ncbi:protein Jumonji isoform X2 [Sipha flava]|uniref:Protein Jumonji n=1 Tax=Sipha flava TaxID=143950 RepID=A0A2S2PZ06_9HEMI|nr:protein Jumonji isoform X2 [Sipha flava]
MSLNGSDAKKRKLLNNDEAILDSSTKKIKVQAQRKFAQNAVTPNSTPQKPIQTPVVPNNSIKPPIKRPNTEDFLTFLCFRGTSLLPPRLDFFNKPQRSLSAHEIAVGKKRRKSTPILPVTNVNNINNVNVVNNEPSERKTIRQLPQTKYPLSKLGQKVIGRNLVRSSSRYAVRQEALTLRQLSLRHGSKIKKPKLKVKKPLVEEIVKKETKKNGKQVSLDGKQLQKLKGRITRSNSLPSIFCPAINQLRDDKGKWCKGDNKPSLKTSEDSKDSDDIEEERPSRKKTASNLNHRSNSLGNIKQKTSLVKVTNKNDRKTRSLASKHKNNDQDNYVIPDKKYDKNLKTVSKSNKANSLIETKLSFDVKRRTSSVDNIKTSHENKDLSSSTRSRPPRRTKEAATLFMEMLRKDMRCADEQEDETSSVESFPDLPNTRINEQRERELKVFSKKNKIEKQQEKQRLENQDDKSSLLVLDKKNVVEKKVKENKKSEIKTFSKKKIKKIAEVLVNSDNNGTTSFKRNLRPRRSSTMLDDYIITDSEEDYDKFEFISEVNKNETPKPSIKVTTAGISKIQNHIISTEESAKKNFKINKTDLKLKKDLNKIDSEIKKSLSETKSKNILLKYDKEPEIKKNKYATVDQKIEKLSKNKTENVVITKEPKTSDKGLKSVGKKVPLSIKLQQKSAKKEKVSKDKKSNLDLYNNNNKKPSTTLSSSVVSSSSSIFSGITSQSKEELLERMAANFDAKSTACEDTKKSTVKNETSLKKVEDNSIALEKKKENEVETTLLQQYESYIPTTEILFREKKVENSNIVLEKKEKCDTVDNKKEDHIVEKLESIKAVELKQELKVVSKTENIVAKEENVATPRKVENVVLVVDRVEKTESIMVPFNKVEKVENIVFQTIAKDLFLGQQKEIKITMPEYFSGKNFQVPNRFKQDDGLSVLSEICSALPRFNEPFVPNGQLINKYPTTSESSFVKYTSSSISSDEKKEDKSVLSTLTPPSFESRTMKMVNLARENKTVTRTNDKKDLTASWRQAFKNVKLPKNNLALASYSSGNNLISWTKNKHDDNQTLPQVCTDNVDGNSNGEVKEIITDNDLVKTTFQSSLVNGSTAENKLESSQPCQKTYCSESKTTDVLDSKKTVANNASYLAKRTLLNSTKYDLKFEKHSATAVVPTTVLVTEEKQQRKDVVSDVSSSDDLSPEKKIFHQRRLSTNQSCSGNSSDAFSPDNETSVYAFQPDLPVASTPFRRNKPQSPAKSRTVSPNTSIAVSIENDSMEEKSHHSTVSSTTDVDSEEGRLFYIPLPAGVQAQPLIQGVTVKLGTQGPQNKLVMSAKLVTKPPASTIPVSMTPVGTVQPTTRSVQPTKSTPSTSKQVLPLSLQPEIPEVKDEKKRLQQVTNITATKNNTSKESKKTSVSSLSSVSGSDNKKFKKTEKHINNKRKCSEKLASKKKECADMMDAPTFYPSEEDFKDPLEYFEIIKPVARKYGICRVVPPPSFKPECKVSDDMRFTAYNQFVHKMMNRWGPNVREMMAMKKYLKTQSIVFSNPPLIGGMELDLPRLYHTVQDLGGLKEVIELDKWCRVADLMKIPKSAQDRVSKLDDIYCKYLLPYDTLSHEERQKLIAEVDKEWKQVCKKGDSDNELFEDVSDCITKGRSIALSAYYRVARNTVAMWFKEQQQQQPQGSGNSSLASKMGAAAVRAEDVESFYWKQVQEKKNHICVLSGSIDSGAEGYGFPTSKTATFTKHPWNLKVLTNNPVSVLKSLGPVMGMTVPTIHMGMVFSACCWYKDPHGLPWIEYLHTGADKVWYGVPSSQSDKFRAAMKRLLPRAVAEGQNHHTWLAADSGMVPPDRLLEHGVTLTRTVQNPGQFLIVMPRAYTCNVSTGYVISESVYFTQSGWLNDSEKIFQDLQRNCEPAAFSYEKLLINMSMDPRTPQKLLKQLLNILSNMRDCEVALRSQLVEDLGLKVSERIRPLKSSEQNDDYECDVCHSILYISMVNNSHEDCDYCLRHGIEMLSKKHNQLKYCKFLYTLDEMELDSILVKLRERIDSKKKKTSTKS